MNNIFVKTPFEINSCLVEIEIDKELENATYCLKYNLTKVDDGEDIFRLNSPLENFEYISAYDATGNELKPERRDTPGVARLEFRPHEEISVSESYYYEVSYKYKLVVELVKKKGFNKLYGIVLTRSFGSFCNELKYQVKIRGLFNRLKYSIPRGNSFKQNTFYITELKAGQPYSVSLIIEQGIPSTLGIGLGYIIMALVGYYVPKLFILLLNFLTSLQ